MAARVHRVTVHKSAMAGIETLALASNHHFPRHSHDQFGIGVISSGAQRSWSGIGNVTAAAGAVIMVNPGEIHDGAPLDDNGREWRMIYIEQDVMRRELRDEIPRQMEFIAPVANDRLLAEQFSISFEAITAGLPDYFAVEQEWLCLLLKLAKRHVISGVKQSRNSPSVARAKRYIDGFAAQPISLQQLAALSGTSRFQLLRGFFREVGLTPHAYLVQQRVRIARRLLAHRHAPANAAMLAGFADQSHMTRAFVRQLGITPARYRAAVA